MHYISTRGLAPQLNFKEVLLAGLAADGGLYVPKHLPALDLARLKGLNYAALAAEVMHPFMGGFMSKAQLLEATTKTYANFAHADVAPVVALEPNHYVLELFHGPTLAFKDFALQLFGHLLRHALHNQERVVVLGATSGDTGSAALAGVAGIAGVESFILFPHGRVSEVQRRQMTTLAGENIHCLAVEGTFDDCQNIVKTLFADAQLRARVPLVAVNSINWARVLAQVVYYVHAYLTLGVPLRFCVPTGNFGDIFAGYIARGLGVPIERLVIATNANDILARCVDANDYSMKGVTPTLSPSMDIQISSNFERLLFDLVNRDAAALKGLMDSFKATGTLSLPGAAHTQLTALFGAHACDDTATLATMKQLHAQGYLADPHTATGIHAARKELGTSNAPMVTLATAHPAKFPDAVKQATSIHPALPAHLHDLFQRSERYEVVPADINVIRKIIQ